MDATTTTPIMDREFIARNQIVERYLSGMLPPKGALDFERFCRAHPELLDELGLPERVHAGVKLLEASGKPEPWEQTPRRFWEQPKFTAGLGALSLLLLAALAWLAANNSEQEATIAELRQQVEEQPLRAVASTRAIRVVPSRTGESDSPAITIGGGNITQLADFRIDQSRSPYRAFRVTLERAGQGRVAVLHNLHKDSNGHLRIALNDSALGAGLYHFTIEGLSWRGEPSPDAWVTIAVRR